VVRGLVSEELIERLRWHAGLLVGQPQRPGTSISSCIDWTGKTDARLRDGTADFIEALGELNVALNGPEPSKSTDHSALIPREVAYAIAEVTRLLRDVAGRGPEAALAADAAWSIEAGWAAVLAGDIDDIPGHVAEERRARVRVD
jgi:hypothetical protein